jgi:hypothetical protein
VTNCGDSAVAVVKADGTLDVLTEDHGTLNKVEVHRVLSVGSSLRPQVYRRHLPFPFCVCTETVQAKPRLYPGGLLVTRSFGDFAAKLPALGGIPGSVVADHGEIKYRKLSGSHIKYILLGSDGFWDALSTDDILIRLPGLPGRKSPAPHSKAPAQTDGSPPRAHPSESEDLDVVGAVRRRSNATASAPPASSPLSRSLVSILSVRGIGLGPGGAGYKVADVHSEAARSLCRDAVTSPYWRQISECAFPLFAMQVPACNLISCAYLPFALLTL